MSVEYAWVDDIDQERVISEYRVNGGDWTRPFAHDADTGAAIIPAGPEDTVELRYEDGEGVTLPLASNP